MKLKAAGAEKKIAAAEAVRSLTAGATVEAVDPQVAGALVEKRCTECHDLDELDEHGGDDEAGWMKILEQDGRRGRREGNGARGAEGVNFLTATRPKTGAGPAKIP